MKFTFGILEFETIDEKVYLSKIGDRHFPKTRIFKTVLEGTETPKRKGFCRSFT